MSNSELLDQLMADTSTLIKWANEETNQHMQRMLIDTVKLSQQITLRALAPGDLNDTSGLEKISIAVKKLTHIYNR